MKISIRFLAVMLMAALHSYAQKMPLAGFSKSDLPVVSLPLHTTIHFVSPEPIQYVDISSHLVKGDLPVRNILRIRLTPDSLKSGLHGDTGSDAVLTIVGEKFVAQYRLVLVAAEPPAGIQTDVEILPGQTRPLDFPAIGLSQFELKSYALQLLGNKPEKYLEHSSAYGLQAKLNHIYTLGDYIFLDISYRNKTNLKYDIDELRFKIADQKVTKASNVQSIEIKPEFTLFDITSFKKNYRNIFVLKKFTFPGNKLLEIELSERQLSGRIIDLHIPYQDILAADIIPSN